MPKRRTNKTSRSTKHRMVWFSAEPSTHSIAFCSSKKAWMRWVKNTGVPDKGDNWGYPSDVGRNGVAHCTTMITKDGECSIITIKDSVDKNATPFQIIGVLAHECVHCWQHVLEDMDEKKPSPEFEAYFLQGLIQRTVQAYCQTRRNFTLTGK